MAILIFMMPVFPAHGQEHNFGPCSLPVDWSNIHLNTEGQPENPARILLVTNRQFNTETADGEFFTNELSEYRM